MDYRDYLIKHWAQRFGLRSQHYRGESWSAEEHGVTFSSISMDTWIEEENTYCVCRNTRGATAGVSDDTKRAMLSIFFLFFSPGRRLLECCVNKAAWQGNKNKLFLPNKQNQNGNMRHFGSAAVVLFLFVGSQNVIHEVHHR